MNKSPSDIVVVIGDTAKCDADVGSKSYEVEQIIFHYAYDHSTFNDDIVLLKLTTEIMMNGIAAKVIELAPEGSPDIPSASIGSNEAKQ